MLRSLPISGLLLALWLPTAAPLANAQGPLLAEGLVDAGPTGTGTLVNALGQVDFAWTEQQDAGGTPFNLSTMPMVNGAEAWRVDTDVGDQLTVVVDYNAPVNQPQFFIASMDDADLDFSPTPGADAFLIEQTGGMVESGPDLFTAPSGADAAGGTIGLSGIYTRVTFTIRSDSGRDVLLIAAGASSPVAVPGSRFRGGVYDGHDAEADLSYDRDASPQWASPRFGGGAHDGYDAELFASYDRDASPQWLGDRFGGGTYDGYDAELLTSYDRDSSLQWVGDRFAGGAHDGYAAARFFSYERDDSPQWTGSRFAGGGHDGFDLVTITNQSVLGSADLQLVKTGPSEALAGTELVYNLLVSNVGPADANNVVLTETLPPGTIPASVGPFDLGFLPAGASTNIEVRVTAGTGTLGPITNRAELTTSSQDVILSNNVATTVTVIRAEADLSVAKTGPAIAAPGTTVQFELAVTNDGPSDATSVELEDLLPAGMTAQGDTQFDLGTLPAGIGTSVVVIADIDPAATGTLINRAVVRSATPNPSGVTTATVAVALRPFADLQLVKTGPATATPGESAQFVLVVTNVGPSDAIAVVLEDLLPPGLVPQGGAPTRFELGDLPVGATTTVVVTADIDASAIGPRTNRATLTSDTSGSPHPASAREIRQLDPTAPSGVYTIDPDGAGPAAPFEAYCEMTTDGGGWTLVSANTWGDFTLPITDAARIDDPGFDGSPSPFNDYTVGPVMNALTFDEALLVVYEGNDRLAIKDAADTYPWVSQVQDGYVVIENTIAGIWHLANYFILGMEAIDESVQGDRWDARQNTVGIGVVNFIPGSNGDNVAGTYIGHERTLDGGGEGYWIGQFSTTAVDADHYASFVRQTPTPAAVTAEFIFTLVPEANLTVSKSGPANAVPGESAQFVLTVTNAGPSDATFVELEDLLPVGMTAQGDTQFDLGTLPAGIGTSVVVIADIDPAATGVLTNRAVVRSATANHGGITTADFAVALSPGADLTASLSAPGPVTAGESFLITLTVSNLGPSTAVAIDSTILPGSGLEFLDLFPPSFAILGPGASASADLTVRAPSDLEGVVTAAVSVAATTPDPTLDGNTGRVDIVVQRVANLSLVKTGPATALAGESIVYDLVVSNAGPSDAVDLQLIDQLPAGLVVESPLSFDLPRLRPGESVTRQVQGRSAPDLRGPVTNEAVLASHPAVPSAFAVTDIRGEADLSLVKTATAELLDTNVIEYLLTVSNAGPTPALDLRVNDPLPAGTALLPGGSDPACSDLGTSVVCRVAHLSAGVVTSFLLRIEVQTGLARTLTNLAIAASADSDPKPVDNADDALTVLVDTDGDLLADFADPDDDNDTMTDEWENRYGLNQRDPTDGPVDGDGDRVPNDEEFAADTRPDLATDFLHIMDFDAAGLLMFPSKATRQYRLQSTLLAEGPYVDMGLPPIPGDGTVLQVPVPNAVPLRFFRLVPEFLPPSP